MTQCMATTTHRIVQSESPAFRFDVYLNCKYGIANSICTSAQSAETL